MKPITGILALAVCLSGSVAQADYWARNRMAAATVPLRAGYFEVLQKATARPKDYFCAAGEYVRYGERLSNTLDIYVVRGLGPSITHPRRHSVIFSYVRYDDIPVMSAAEKGYSVTVSRPGFFLSAGHASAFCKSSVRWFRRNGLLGW